MNYAEYLRSLGATAEEIAILDTPAGRRAYDKMQTDLAAANAERDKAQKLADDTKDWFDNVQTPEWEKMQNELIVAKAQTAKMQTALRTAEDRGLLNITKDLGIDLATPGTPAGTPTGTPSGTPAGFDPTKYVTLDQVKQIANQEGAAIALAQDIAAEHAILFPGQRLNFTQLREEALVAKKSVMQHWSDKFKVPEARAAKEQKEREAHDTKMREEGAKAERERIAKEFGSNPDLRTPVPSSSPFTVRKTADDLRSQQPWARNESSLSDDRVRRATERAASREAGRVN